MIYKDVIKTVELNPGKQTINLKSIYPIDPINDSEILVTYLIGNEKQERFLDSYYAEQLIIDSKVVKTIDIKMGKGYFAEKDEDLSNRFLHHNGWSGGDGIYSFNLTNGNDAFDQKQNHKTLFVFGDTFVGRSDPITFKRYQPHLMPNNSLAYLENDKLEFKLNWQKNGQISAFYHMDDQFDYEGSVADYLTVYDSKKGVPSYLSGYNPERLELIFDLQKPQEITHIDIYNYFSKEADHLAKRGLKNISLFGSNDKKTYNHLQDVKLKMSQSFENYNSININSVYRYFKIVVDTTEGMGNYNDKTYKEGLYGLNKVKFYHQKKLYRDIKVTSTHVLLKDKEHSWIWLQDGVVINKHLYFLPLIVNGDQSQPEGLQFKIKGVSLFKTPIRNKMIVPEKRTQKMAPLLVYDKASEFLFGGAIMANTKQAGSKIPDGYIYVYGYKTTLGLREMIVARVKEEEFEYFDSWTFYNGKEFVDDILASKAILQHISCEFSVSPILKGLYKGMYLAVFTYDVNTPYVSFSLGDSPYGPFTKAQKVYHTPELELYQSTTYTYNAKAHPHLSMSEKILVTYNTNTYNFDHNMSNYKVYRPRFIYLTDTTK